MLGSVVPLRIDSRGYLNLLIEVRGTVVPGRVEVVPTRWNLERDTLAYVMRTDLRPGVVLHWDGAPTGNQRSIHQLVRGLNESVHFVTKAELTNSAHFGVGGAPISVARDDPTGELSVAQLQHPWHDGVPLIASHLNPRVGKPDFRRGTPEQCLAVMRALTIESTLRAVFDGVWIDPNYRTVAIEITGSRFDRHFPHGLPPTQVISNLLSLLSALLRHFSLGPWDVLGHQELQFDKPDPGKLFTALIRYLLGILALVNPGSRLRKLTFGVINSGHHLIYAARHYFTTLAEYVRRLVLSDDYEAWLSFCGLWDLVEFLREQEARMYEGKLSFPSRGL